MGSAEHAPLTEDEDLKPVEDKALSDTNPDRGDLKKKDQELRDAFDLRVSIEVFGTSDPKSIHALLDQLILVTPEYDQHSRNLEGALATLRRIAPRDELERLLAVQMVGVHNAAIKCLALASPKGQTPAGTELYVPLAVRLLRTFAAQIDVLNRHRGRIGQPMVVGNVNVNDGGQAIVGPVARSGRENASAKDHGKNTE